MLEAGGGGIGCDADNGFPNPFTYASVGIMIEAVHAAWSHSFVYLSYSCSTVPKW